MHSFLIIRLLFAIRLFLLFVCFCYSFAFTIRLLFAYVLIKRLICFQDVLAISQPFSH